MSEQDRPNPYEAVIADLQARKEQEIRRITEKYDNAIAALKDLLSSPVTVAAGGSEVWTTEPVEIQIRIGEFHGMPLTSAARAILERNNKHPLRTDEIVKLVEKSGRKLSAANPSANLYSSLKRNPDFELVAPNTWGLTEWYPGSKRKAKARSLEEVMRDEAPIPLGKAIAIAEQEAANAIEADRKEHK